MIPTHCLKIKTNPFRLRWHTRNNTILEIPILQEEFILLRNLWCILFRFALRIPKTSLVRRPIREEDADGCLSVLGMQVTWHILDVLHWLSLPQGEPLRHGIADGLSAQPGDGIQFFGIVDLDDGGWPRSSCCGLRGCCCCGRLAKGRWCASGLSKS